MSDKNNESKDNKGYDYDELCNALNATFDALDNSMRHILESLGLYVLLMVLSKYHHYIY